MNSLSKIEKSEALKKYRDLCLATLQFYVENHKDFLDFDDSKSIKHQIYVAFDKGRLTYLKRNFENITEPLKEMNNLRISSYLKEKTGYEIDLNTRFNKKIDKILERKN